MNIVHQLNYFSSLSDAYNISGIRQEIEALYRKTSDKTLYLAVIGEFSSGKSTFINALLRKRLLKESILPTTACATYISGGANQLKVNVKFADSLFIVDEKDMYALSTYLMKHYNVYCTNLWTAIDVLTSEQDVTCDVKYLSLTIPNIHLPKDIVIIDTPGFNPGESSLKNHYGITERVVSEGADIALVTMSSCQPYTNSTKQFLQKHLLNYLHRCVFVLTMGDYKSLKERFEVVEYVKIRLRQDFGLQSPVVFCESPIAMLPVKKLSPKEQIELKWWQNEFCVFEDYIWELMRKQKEIILAEHLYHLALKTTRELQSGLQMKYNRIESEQKYKHCWFSKVTTSSIQNNLTSLRFIEYEIKEQLNKMRLQ